MNYPRLLVAWLFVLALAARTQADPALPKIPDKTFAISEFGAKGDGTTDDTKAIAAALDAAEKAGGGTVRFSPGKYLTGNIMLRSQVGLHLEKDATILFTTNPEAYPVVLTRWECTECMNYSGLMGGRDIHDVAITGEGTIDGQGAAWWPWARRSSARKLRELGEMTDDPTQRIFGTVEAGLRPCLFEPINCQRILLEGVTFTNSPFWTLHPIYCSDITVRKITVRGTGPNTDGFDPDSCANILVEESTFDTGDDCITLKSGRDKDGRRVGKPLENVVVRNCNFAKGHGTVVIGSEMSGGVRNVLVENVTADGTDAGVRIKTRRGRGGVVENITYRNMSLKNIAKQAITIDMFYDVGGNPAVDQTGPDGIPVIRNITIENLKCDGAAQGIVIKGLPDSLIKDVTLTNVSIINAKQRETISGVENLKKTDVSVNGSPSTQPGE